MAEQHKPTSQSDERSKMPEPREPHHPPTRPEPKTPPEAERDELEEDRFQRTDN
jgi:hypothetical protein